MSEWYDLQELVDKAQELIEYGFNDEAKELLNDYYSVYDDKWELHFLLSRIYSEENNNNEAISQLEKALLCDNDNLECLLAMFFAQSINNDLQAAEKYLQAANEKYPENETVHSTLVWYYTETNQLKRALSYFERFKETDSTNSELFRNGGLAYQRSGSYDKAEFCFKRALDISPQNDEIIDLLADYYVLTQEHLKAISLYQDALKMSQKNIRILSRLVYCYTQAEQLQQASSIAKEIIRLYPNTPVGYIDLAFVHINNNNFDEALECAKKALDVSPLNSEAYRIEGIAYSEKKEYDKAEKAFETAIANDEKNTDIIRDYYQHLKNVGQFDKMEEMVHTAIKLDTPYCIEDYLFLTDYFLEKNQYLKAFHYLKTAYKSMPEEKEFLPPIIDILLERGHFGYSVWFFMKYIEKKGWNNVMNDFSRHRCLKSKLSQEGIRLLRFAAINDHHFHKYVFLKNLKKTLLISLTLLIPAFLLPITIIFGTKGIVISSLCLISILGLFLGINFFIHKRAEVNRNHAKGVLS